MKIDSIKDIQSSYQETFSYIAAKKSEVAVSLNKIKEKQMAVETQKVIKAEKEDSTNLDVLKKNEIDYEQIEKIKKEILTDVKFEYSIDDITNRIMIRVKDKESDKLICEIPPEKVIKMAAFLKEYVSLKIDTRR